MLVFENAILNSHLLEFPFSWHFACFPLWDSGFYFFQEIVPHFVYLLNPFLSVFPCKRAKSCFSKSFCRLARRWPRIPFARDPIFNALCLFWDLGSQSHLLEIPFARERTVYGLIHKLQTEFARPASKLRLVIQTTFPYSRMGSDVRNRCWLLRAIEFMHWIII